MTKLEKEQARGLERPSRWQGVKKWLMSHKIETTAILVCLLGTAAILAIVYVPSDEAPSPTSVVNTPNTGDSESTPNNGDVGGTDAPSGNEEESDDIVGDVPPPAPSTDAIMDSPIFQKLLLLTDLQDTSSPQYKAADWLIALDFLKLGAEAPNLQQRFALATFYMATGGGLAIKNGWTRCSAVPPPTENDNNEAASNIQCMVHNGNVICAERGNFETCDFTDDSGTMSQGYRFLSPVNECEWFGITCDDSGVVTRIDIGKNLLIARYHWHYGGIFQLSSFLFSSHLATYREQRAQRIPSFGISIIDQLEDSQYIEQHSWGFYTRRVELNW